jgi:hypothetical protein
MKRSSTAVSRRRIGLTLELSGGEAVRLERVVRRRCRACLTTHGRRCGACTRRHTLQRKDKQIVRRLAAEDARAESTGQQKAKTRLGGRLGAETRAFDGCKVAVGRLTTEEISLDHLPVCYPGRYR